MRGFVILAVFLMTMAMGVKAYEHFFPGTHDERAQVTIGEETFELEIASTHPQRKRGLMHRTDLAPCGGMVFLFPEEKPMAFWMHDTPTPLWMAFVNRDHRITRLIPRAEPENDTPLDSLAPANRVIEIDAGCPRLAKLNKDDNVAITYPNSVRIQ